MKEHSNPYKNKASLREKIIGLGERSVRKSYYPQLQRELKKLAESEKKYRELAQLLPQVVFETDEKGNLLFVNHHAFNAFGYTQDDFDKGLNAFQMFIPRDRERAGKDILRILNGEHIGNLEYTALRKDGMTFPVLAYVSPVIRENKPVGVRGILINVTERKQTEEEQKKHVRFLESLERVDKAIKHATDIEQMLRHILETVFSIFDCDRTWLLYPCDPDAPTFRVPMEITKPEYPGAKVLNVDVPILPDLAQNLREALASDEPVIYIAGTENPINKVTAEQFGVQSQMFVALYPKLGKPWVFGMHQCSHPRTWTNEEKKLFAEIARRISDGLSSVLFLRELQENEQRFRAISDYTYDWESWLGPDSRLLWVNSAVERLTGYSQDECLSMPDYPLSLIHPQDRVEMAQHFRGTEDGSSGNDIPFRIQRKDGNIVWASVSWQPIFDVDGKNIGYRTSVRDITERKRTEEALCDSVQQWQTTFDAMNECVFLLDSSFNILRCNKASYTILGKSPEELVGHKCWEVMHGTSAPIDWCPVDRMWKTRKRESSVAQMGERWIEVYANPLLDSEGSLIGSVHVIADITDRKRAEDALRLSEAEQHDAYFAQSAINIILSESLEGIPLELILQKALNIILAVPWLSFEPIGSIHIVENEPEVLVMKAWYNLPEQQKKLCAKVPFGTCLCGLAALTKEIQFADHIDERHGIRYEGMVSHGHYIVPLVFGSRTIGVLDIYLKEGHIRDEREEEFLRSVADTLAGIIVRKQGEDEREKLNAQLLQAQKMEAVGQLAGGIAHDFNNILTAMIGYGHLLKMKLKEDESLSKYADHILSLSDRAANLTQSLLSFSRKRIMNPEPVNLNEIIKRIDHLLSRIIGEDIKLQTLLSEKDLIIMADSGHIEQALMNLATNARDAMPKGGLLSIATEKIAIDEEFIRDHGFGTEGEYALIAVTDTGAGMDRETREKIFEPFFTTKEVGKGTGLGLSMVYGVIEQHGGYLNVYSEPGSGTTFRIYLPLIEAKVDEIKPEVIHPVERGTETVLLAEDEEAIREFTKKMLEEYGYRVITAASGQEAIDEFKAHKDEIRLLLLDVIMPNRNGREAYEEIKKIRPDIKVLFMSGYPTDIIHKHKIIEKGFAYIDKPASPTKLLRKIREVLGKYLL
jgi:PAS domain S-box-containing protein